MLRNCLLKIKRLSLTFLKEKDEKKAEAEETGLEFPSANLFELENRVFTDSWSIPYKREESLAKCLIAATRLAHEGNMNKSQIYQSILYLPDLCSCNS